MLPTSCESALNKLDISVNVIKEQDFSFSNVILGQGAQGIVVKGKYLGSDVAIKSIPIIKEKVKYLLREIALLDKIRHPNIISVMAVCSTDTKCHIIMEFFKSHSLQDIIFNKDKGINFIMDLTMKRKIALQLSYAVAYLHLQPQPIIHRDIKPANILINEHSLTKLCDLGLGKSNSFCDSLDSTYHGRWRGTLPYMAPEILLDNENANESSDIWSLACTFIELFSEQKVWNVHNVSGMIKILNDKETPRVECMPQDMRVLIRQCFSYNKSNRPTIRNFLSLLEKK
ncbi:putative mitogen-activated protein kinase kinase kinase 7-like [Leptopilina heterotoma]|uniref:putative mitogen-activated protein kinase kinase kinase 7-like n=1 Tax=Leptopilina heterotoma TaxID=63436 RepID=UPI001CA8851C|nr:putative mitogen-activated protein kinase kinase kinase 7-like [Leptopilina heterotoma]